MKYIILSILFVFSISAFAEHKYNTVAVVSIDALHPDAVRRDFAPNIFRLIDSGFYSSRGLSSRPPKTLVAHTAMITGLDPLINGKIDNEWKKGEKRVGYPTLIDYAKSKGYETALIYSKQKLGYLSSPSVDKEIFSGQDAVEKAVDFINVKKPQFLFLHVSGLDFEGPVTGWMSPEYMDEFRFIDEQLGVLFRKIQSSGSALIIVTSDHAGHDKHHGTDHPEDYKRPLAVWSSTGRLSVPDSALKIDGLKTFIESEM